MTKRSANRRDVLQQPAKRTNQTVIPERTLRVCIVSYYFAPSVGGVETYTVDLATFLASQGVSVSVVTWTPGDGNTTYPFTVHRRPGWRALARIVQGADVVHFNTLNPLRLMLAKLLGKTAVWAHFDYHTVCPIGIAWWEEGSCSFGWRRCARHLFPSRGPVGFLRTLAAFWLRQLASRLVDRNVVASSYGLQRIAPPRAAFVPLGINTAEWTTRREESQQNRFLFWGRHIPEKGADVLIRALGLIRQEGYDATAYLCGTGPATDTWKALAASLGLDGAAMFLGYVEPACLQAELAAATAVVVPSLHDEYVGLVALEGMSAAKPVIASRVGGLAEIVAEGGVLFERGDARDLADKMITVMEDKTLREELGRRGRQTVLAKYTVELMGQRYLELYWSLLGDGMV